MDAQKDAWETLYRGQSRPWRGVADLGFMSVEPGERVLDLGCGNGKTSQALIDRGASVVGVDFSQSAIDSCRKNLGTKADFLVADIRDLPFSDETFDVVVSVHVIEHVPGCDFPRAVSEVMRVLRKGGTLYLRCFAEGDMRSGGCKEDVRNGILYRYFSEEDILQGFSDYDIVSVERIEEPTRFGTVRKRLQCVIRK